MCLVSYHEKYVAYKDIVCYKSLEERGGKIVTPFRHRRVPKRVLEGKRCFRAHGIPKIERYGEKNPPRVMRIVSRGFIHVMSSPIVSEFFIIKKCIIPKGTVYYASDDGKEYAARKIKFVK